MAPTKGLRVTIVEDSLIVATCLQITNLLTLEETVTHQGTVSHLEGRMASSLQVMELITESHPTQGSHSLERQVLQIAGVQDHACMRMLDHDSTRERLHPMSASRIVSHQVWQVTDLALTTEGTDKATEAALGIQVEIEFQK